MSGDFIQRGDVYPVPSPLNSTGVLSQSYRGVNASIGQDGRVYAASNGGGSGSADVSEFGVIYNNLHVDNTAAMQRAINAAQGQQGYELILSGFVNLNNVTPLTITGSISIRGLQPWNNVDVFTGFIQQNSNTITILQTSTNREMWLRDFMILYINGGTPGVPAIKSLPSVDVIFYNRFYNLGFFQVGTGIDMHNNALALIDSCFFSCFDRTQATNYGVKLSGSGDFVNFGDTTIVQSTIESFNVGVYQTGSPGLRIVNNKFLLNDTSYQLAQANGFGDLFIWNNSIESCVTKAIDIGTTGSNTYGEIIIENNEIQGDPTMVESLIIFRANLALTAWNTGVTVNDNHLIYQASTAAPSFVRFSGCSGFSMTGNVLLNYGAMAFPAYTIDSSCLNGNVENNAATFGPVQIGTNLGTNITQNTVANRSTVTNTNVPYYDANGFLTSDSTFNYVTAGHQLSVQSMQVTFTNVWSLGARTFIAAGTDQQAGTTQLTGGTVTINNSLVTANTRVVTGSRGNVGFITYSINTGAHTITFTSSIGADTGFVDYFIFFNN